MGQPTSTHNEVKHIVAKTFLFAFILALTMAGIGNAATINVYEPTCTLVDAITAANEDRPVGGCRAGSGADTIVLVKGSIHTLTAVNNILWEPTGLPVITSEIIILGNGSTVQRDLAAEAFRLLHVWPNGNLTINGLTLKGGNNPYTTPRFRGGGGLLNNGGILTLNDSTVSGNTATNSGGGLLNWDGILTLNNSTVSGNTTYIGGVDSGHGGGLYSAGGTLTISTSTVSDNTAYGRGGGLAIYGGTVILTNSTISKNTASNYNTSPYGTYGGGLFNDRGTVTLTNVTVSGNKAPVGGGLAHGQYGGALTLINCTVTGNAYTGTGYVGGLYALAPVTVVRTIIAGNSESLRGNGKFIIDKNYNLIGHSSSYEIVDGETLVPIVDLDSILDPMLKDNGGATFTHALISGSPAIDAAGPPCPPPAPADRDQRDVPRPQGGGCDIGAFEYEYLKKPRLTVKKILIPSTDPGKFNLLVNGVIKASNVGDGGTTGAIIRPLGPVTVSESAGTGTILANYIRVFGGDFAANGTTTLVAGDNKTCTITNTRKPTLTVTKILIPSSDPGKFNLHINGVIKARNVGDGGTTGAVTLYPGTYRVSESAVPPEKLSDYVTVFGGDCAANGTITLKLGDKKTCTITNTIIRKLRNLYVTEAGSGNGSVIPWPMGERGNLVCVMAPCPSVYLYPHNTPVTLTAIANGDSVFTGWSGHDCTGTGICMVTMNADKSVTATFERIHTLTITTNGDGIVISSPIGIDCGTDCTEDYIHGTPVTLTATPNHGSTFTGWSGPDTGECATGRVVMNANKSCTATFNLNSYYLDLSTAGNGSGTVTGGGWYLYNHTAPVTATPNHGSTFTGWSGPDTGECATGRVVMNANKSCTATFNLNTYYLNLSTAGNGSGTVTGGGGYLYNHTAPVTATPNHGSTFTGWSGPNTGECATGRVVMNANKSCTATFQLRDFHLGVKLTDASGGSYVRVTANGYETKECHHSSCTYSYLFNTKVKLVAVSGSHREFKGWKGDCTNPRGSCRVIMGKVTTNPGGWGDGHKKVTAVFKRCNIFC